MASREEWRAWLEKNHSTKSEIWLLFYKQHTGKPCVSYDDALDEALCFGWVDSIVKRVDDERYLRKFTPRKNGSIWSEANKKRAERLIREGRMTQAGLARVKEVKESGKWSMRRVGEKELKVPAFFEQALATNEKALENLMDWLLLIGGMWLVGSQVRKRTRLVGSVCLKSLQFWSGARSWV